MPVVVAAYPSGIATDAEWEEELIGFGGGDGAGNMRDRQSYSAAEWFNKNKKEIQAIQSELGILPKGIYGSVAERFNSWEGVGVGTFPDGDTTPSVANSRVFNTGNTAPTTITMLNDGVAGWVYVIIFADDNTTIQSSSDIRLQGGQAHPLDYTGAQHDTMMLTWTGTEWYETSRSPNGDT